MPVWGSRLFVSLGNERIIGSNLAYWLAVLNEDPNTEAIISIGQRIDCIEEIVAYSKEHGYNKPIIVYLAGLKAPQEKIYHDCINDCQQSSVSIEPCGKSRSPNY